MSKTILIMLSKPFLFTEDQLAQVKKIAPDFRVLVQKSEEVKKEHVENAEVIFGWPEGSMLSSADHLKWLHVPSAGVTAYASKEIFANPDIRLTTSSGTFGKPMAEHAIALIFCYSRNIHRYIRNQSNRLWERYHDTKDFFNSTVGIIGMGDIGSETAQRCKALGARVLGLRRNAGEKPWYVDALYQEKQIDMLLQSSDYVVLALPETPKTKGFLNKQRISAMKKNSFLVNLGRGSAVDQQALMEALQSGHIGGAGLDVMTPEPLPEDHPLWGFENVILTSHSSGLSPTSVERNMEIFLENLEKYQKNDELRNLVDFHQGY